MGRVFCFDECTEIKRLTRFSPPLPPPGWMGTTQSKTDVIHLTAVIAYHLMLKSSQQQPRNLSAGLCIKHLNEERDNYAAVKTD